MPRKERKHQDTYSVCYGRGTVNVYRSRKVALKEGEREFSWWEQARLLKAKEFEMDLKRCEMYLKRERNLFHSLKENSSP